MWSTWNQDQPLQYDSFSPTCATVSRKSNSIEELQIDCRYAHEHHRKQILVLIHVPPAGNELQLQFFIAAVLLDNRFHKCYISREHLTPQTILCVSVTHSMLRWICEGDGSQMLVNEESKKFLINWGHRLPHLLTAKLYQSMC